MKNKFITMVLFCCASFHLHAQEIVHLSQILDSVEAHHPAMEMYDLEVKSMDEAAKGTYSWMAPQLSVGTFMTPYQPNMASNGGGMDMSSAMLSIQQMFPNRAYQKAQFNYMKQFSAIVQASKSVQKNELQQTAKQMYYQLLIFTKRKNIWADNRKLLELMLKNTELRYTNGYSKLNAYYKVKAALGKLKNQQLQNDNAIQNTKIRINTLMNRNAMIDFEVDTSFLPKEISLLKMDTTTLYNQKSEFKFLEEKSKLNSLQIETERKQLRPEWGVNFGHMQPYSNMGTSRFTAMLMVNLPVFSWTNRMNKANIQKIRYENAAIKVQKEMLFLEVSGKAKALQNEIDLKKQQLKLYKEEIIPSFQKSFSATQLAFEQNTEDLWMLYDAWEQLYEAQMAYLDVWKECYEKQADWEQLMEVR